MAMPFSFPDWVPWWVQLLVLVAVILLGLAFALVPFSVIGLKPKLDALEGRLDEIQAELRALAARLPEPARGTATQEAPVLRAWSGDRTRLDPRPRR